MSQLVTKGTLGMSPGLYWPWASTRSTMAEWDGQWDGPRNLRFSCHSTLADSGLLEQVCGIPVSCAKGDLTFATCWRQVGQPEANC